MELVDGSKVSLETRTYCWMNGKRDKTAAKGQKVEVTRDKVAKRG